MVLMLMSLVRNMSRNCFAIQVNRYSAVLNGVNMKQEEKEKERKVAGYPQRGRCTILIVVKIQGFRTLLLLLDYMVAGSRILASSLGVHRSRIQI